MKISHVAAVAAAAVFAGAQFAEAMPFRVKVIVENLSPTNGTFITPAWVGFHDGVGFDLYDSGSPASAALERIAEDGNTGPISDLFAMTGGTGVDGTIGSPLPPGGMSMRVFDLDPNDPNHEFFSYAAMVIPSNDAFIANGSPIAHPIFDGSGKFLGADFIVFGAEVLDAGTEVNTELPLDTPLLGQINPNTGTIEGGVVGPHVGFIPAGNILGNPMFANADFLADNYQVARLRVVAVTPEPTTVLLGAMALGAVGAATKRRRFAGV